MYIFVVFIISVRYSKSLIEGRSVLVKNNFSSLSKPFRITLTERPRYYKFQRDHENVFM